MLRENAVTSGILLTCATLLFVSLSTRADADNTQSNARQYGDALISCSEWTRLSHDPKVMNKPWPENVFLRYASWTTGFVSGASSANPSLHTTSASDIIQFVSDYCTTHPKATIEHASKIYEGTLK
jgi:hypothetical protein